MARIAISLSGEGRGHATRAAAMLEVQAVLQQEVALDRDVHREEAVGRQHFEALELMEAERVQFFSLHSPLMKMKILYLLFHV